MARIAVDIDDTLYSFRDAAVNKLFEVGLERGDRQMIATAYAEWPEWRTPSDMLGLDTWLEIISMVHHDDAILSYTPFPDSVRICRELLRQGNEVVYVTAREENTHGATEEWLGAQGFLSETALRSPFSKRASLVCTHNKTPTLLGCDYMIDDRPKTLVEFVNLIPVGEERRKAFGLSKEYNRALTDVPNIYLAPTWTGIGHYLERKGVLEVAEYA